MYASESYLLVGRCRLSSVGPSDKFMRTSIDPIPSAVVTTMYRIYSVCTCLDGIEPNLVESSIFDFGDHVSLPFIVDVK